MKKIALLLLVIVSVYSGAGRAFLHHGIAAGSSTMPAPTIAEGASYDYASACSGPCLVAEDTFTAPSLDTTLWKPSLFCCTFGLWNAGVFSTPYSGEGTQTNHGFDLEYYDPYPYGFATDNGDGAHLFTNGSGLNFLASQGVVYSVAASATFTWTASWISTLESGLMTMPATGGFFQARVQQPDSTQGGWAAPFWMLPAPSGGDSNAIPNWDVEGGYTCSGASTGNVCNGIGINDVTNGWVRLSGGSQFNIGYHIFGTEYIPGVSVKYFVDNLLQISLTPGSCIASNGGLCASGSPPPVVVCTVQDGTDCFPIGAFLINIGMQVMGNGNNSTNTSPCGGTPCTTQTQGFHTWASNATTGPYTMLINDVQRYKIPGGS